MRSLAVQQLGSTPSLVARPEPTPDSDDILIGLEAASLNPVDVAVASGSFHAGHPELPYVPCIEAVGRVVDDGTRVFVVGGGLGVSRDGTASEVFTAPRTALIEIPDDIDAAVAAALGTAGLAGWLPLTWMAPVVSGETVVVLGATGTAGRIALQAARVQGAGKVVGVGRNEKRLADIADLADEVVPIGDKGLSDRIRDAAEDGVDLIFDALWGDPLVAALGTANAGARVVHVGQSADPIAAIPSGLVRGRQTQILGYSNFAVPRDVLESAYLKMVDLASAGRLRMDVVQMTFSEIDRAWNGVKASAGKFVVVP